MYYMKLVVVTFDFVPNRWVQYMNDISPENAPPKAKKRKKNQKMRSKVVTEAGSTSAENHVSTTTPDKVNR